MKILIPLIIFLAIFLSQSLIRVKENERAVILRMGHFLKICKPGLNFFLFNIDRAIKINLSEKVPEWRGLSETELNEKLKEIAKEIIFKK